MESTSSRKRSKASEWPRKVRVGRVSVTIYRRKTPRGFPAYMVANYATGKRRFDSYSTEDEALDAANRLARQLSEREVVAASLTNDEAAAYAAAVQALKPAGANLVAAAETVAECLKLVGSLPQLLHAAKFYAARHPIYLPQKSVLEAVQECLKAKETSGASERYRQDLRYRLTRFAGAFQCNLTSVTGDRIQAWLDAEEFSPQSRLNFRRVLNLFFDFAIRKGYLPNGWDELERLENVVIRSEEQISIFTPAEIGKLLEAASPEFLPALAIGAFCGLRTAELERLDWREINLAERFVEVTAKNSKTRSRRLVPISDNLAQWLVPLAQRAGRVWAGGKTTICDAQQETAKAAGVPWKRNGLRHSFISYRLALVKNAAQVALEAGNSPNVVFAHYREVVRQQEAERWFGVCPIQQIPNMVLLSVGEQS